MILLKMYQTTMFIFLPSQFTSQTAYANTRAIALLQETLYL